VFYDIQRSSRNQKGDTCTPRVHFQLCFGTCEEMIYQSRFPKVHRVKVYQRIVVRSDPPQRGGSNPVTVDFIPFCVDGGGHGFHQNFFACLHRSVLGGHEIDFFANLQERGQE